MIRFRQTIGTETERAPSRRLSWRTPALGFGAVAGIAMILLSLFVPRLRSTDRYADANSGPIVIATASCNSMLPTAGALDEMVSAHAVQSLTVQNGSEEPQHEALAEANSRLPLDSNR